MSTASSASPWHLTPVKAPFVAGRVLGATVIAPLLALVVSVIAWASDQPALAGIGVGVLGLGWGLSVAAALVAYRKERYAFHDRVIHCTRGGLLSDESTELDVRNITHVKQHLPWLRYKLFGVGDILIESAGSASSEVRLRAVADPDRIYAEVRAVMRRNGFSLRCEKVLHQEQPALVGIVVELAGLIVSGAIALVFIANSLIPSASSSPRADAEGELVATLVMVGSNLAAVGGLLYVVLRFLDLRRRTYTVYDDAVTYEEGFLNRDNAFIPYENVADTDTKRTLVDQVLGLYDVQVSCQGGGSQVKFRRLRRGEALKSAVSGLVDAARKRPLAAAAPRAAGGDAPTAADAGQGPATKPVEPGTRHGPDLVAPEDAWTADLQMSFARALLPAIPLLLFPPAAVAFAIGMILKVTATTYAVRPSSVKSTYRLLTVDEREFAYDKITGLVVQESLFDRLMSTVSVKLWSIGSPMPLELLHIKRDQIDLGALRRQVGILEDSPHPFRCTTSFSLGAWVRANLAGAGAVVVLLVTLVALGALVEPALLGLVLLPAIYGGVHFAYRAFYFSAQQLSFHDDHLRAQTGRLIQRQYFVRYANVKKVQRTRYPGGGLGRLQCYVAGEQVPPYLKGQKGAAEAGAGARVPYAFTAHYLDDVDAVAERFDGILRGVVPPRPDAPLPAPEQPLREAKPAVANTVARTVLALVAAFPLLPLLPLIVGWAVVAVRQKAYVAEPSRLISIWGVIYKSRATVLYDRIDTLQQGQGALNKMFGNGRVTVMTAGSSKPDLVLPDLPGHGAFYDVVRAHYGQ